MHVLNPKIDAFLRQAKVWKDEIQTLRSILLNCGLDEELKWGKPCFMYKGKNVAIIQPFKKHCALLFFKGALFDDIYVLLKKQGENTQSAKRLEFTSKDQIKKTKVKYYVKQAIGVENAGLNVDFTAERELILPDELSRVLKKDSRIKKAFYALTPGRQRGYILHISGAKQSQTRAERVEKCIPKILASKGINDR